MKSIISSVFFVLVGCVVGFLIATQFKESKSPQEPQKINLQERSDTNIQTTPPNTLSHPVPASSQRSILDAQEIIKKLTELKPQIGNKKQSIRQIIHHFQILVDLGPASLDAIRSFFAQNQDIDYGVEGDIAQRSSSRGQTSRTLPIQDMILPPSLRIGLVDVLKEIGGAEAEKILADVLAHSGRAVEVTYVAKVLNEIAPNKYRETALTAAKELLSNLRATENNATLDENAASYLYEIINQYQDTSFAPEALKLLITTSGQIDRNSLNYLVNNLKEQSGPALYHAFNDPRVDNLWDKTLIINAAIPFVGSNAYVDSLFAQILTNESISSQLRNQAIQNLSGVPRNIALQNGSAIQQLQQRIAWLQSMKLSVKDSNASVAIDETVKRVQQTLNSLSTAK